MIHLIQQSCLEKINPYATSFKPSYDSASALVGDEIAYQIVLYSDGEKAEPVYIENLTGMYNHMYLVKQVPVVYPHVFSDKSDSYLLDTAGVLPDCLMPISEDEPLMIGPQLTVLWVCLKTSLVGKFRIRFRFYTDDCEAISDFMYEVIDHDLNDSMISFYEHIYPTSIAADYHVPLFSSRHWELLEQHFLLAAEHGVTHLLTPLYPVVYNSTIHEPVQLFKAKLTKNGFEFNFDLLDSWVHLAQKSGIEHFVLPPLFPDLSAPKVLPFVVEVDRQDVLYFAKGTSSFIPEYHGFLCSLLRKLIKHLRQFNLQTFFSVQLSDGVSEATMENYAECRNMVSEACRPLRILDHVSEPALYNHKEISVPILPMDKIQDILNIKHSLPMIASFDPLSHDALVDLLIAGSSARLRYLGLLSYRYNLTAYMNRGFNYNGSYGTSTYVEHGLNLDAENRFPSGAASLVYPGSDGPIPSIRLKLLLYALQDIRAIEALEKYRPYERVISMIDRECPVCSDEPNLDGSRLLAFRENVNRLLKEYKEKRGE